ncbi:MAG: hypothetical protein ABW184_08620 [Sphingobium sp.]
MPPETMVAYPSIRCLCALFSILLVLLFAGVQGANALDRLQQGLPHGAAHVYGWPGVLTLDAAADHDRVELEVAMIGVDADDGGSPVAPYHHHHNADHGASLPAPDVTHATLPTLASARIAIPRARSGSRSPMTALERPPKFLPAAV